MGHDADGSFDPQKINTKTQNKKPDASPASCSCGGRQQKALKKTIRLERF